MCRAARVHRRVSQPDCKWRVWQRDVKGLARSGSSEIRRVQVVAYVVTLLLPWNTDVPVTIFGLFATVCEKEHEMMIRGGKRRSYNGAHICGTGGTRSTYSRTCKGHMLYTRNERSGEKLNTVTVFTESCISQHGVITTGVVGHHRIGVYAPSTSRCSCGDVVSNAVDIADDPRVGVCVHYGTWLPKDFPPVK